MPLAKQQPEYGPLIGVYRLSEWSRSFYAEGKRRANTAWQIKIHIVRRRKDTGSNTCMSVEAIVDARIHKLVR